MSNFNKRKFAAENEEEESQNTNSLPKLNTFGNVKQLRSEKRSPNGPGNVRQMAMKKTTAVRRSDDDDEEVIDLETEDDIEDDEDDDDEDNYDEEEDEDEDEEFDEEIEDDDDDEALDDDEGTELTAEDGQIDELSGIKPLCKSPEGERS